MSAVRRPNPASPAPGEPEPAWDIAQLFPPQGCWSEEDYLALDTNRRVEFTDGIVEVLPVPTTLHHLILAFLYDAMRDYVRPRDLGLVLFAGIRVKIPGRSYREPDLVYMSKQNASRIANQFWTGADLAMEVVSEDDPDRDFVKKRHEYAAAGIPEYWIVDPASARIIVLALPAGGGEYAVHGEFTPGQTATSALLPGFEVDVAKVFAVGRGVV